MPVIGMGTDFLMEIRSRSPFIGSVVSALTCVHKVTCPFFAFAGRLRRRIFWTYFVYVHFQFIAFWNMGFDFGNKVGQLLLQIYFCIF
jgi:hypothetical protein